MTRFRVFVTVALFLGAACARDGALDPGGDGLTRILLTDAPFPFDRVSRVDVFVETVAATETADTTLMADGWVTIAEPGAAFNLLDLQRGTTELIGEGEMPVGVYEAVRVVIDVSRSSITLTDGSNAAVDWQSEGQMVLHAVVEDPLDIPVDGASIVIDFDVGRSFLPVGGGFVFIPWVRAVNEAATGTLVGSVQGPVGAQGELAPIADATVSVFPSSRPVYNGALPMATARTDATGEFVMPFVVEGTYTVQADPPSGVDAGRLALNQVSVNAGAETTVNVTLPEPTAISDDETLRIHGNQLLGIGESAAFVAYLIGVTGDSVPASQAEWFTTNPAIASISGAGQAVTVTGLASGLALVFASVDGVNDSLLVSVGGVMGDVGSVELAPVTHTIDVGDSTYVHATIRDENGIVMPGQAVSWSVSNPSIVSLMEGFSGDFAVIWGLEPGTATVTATANGKSGSSTVVVN